MDVLNVLQQTLPFWEKLSLQEQKMILQKASPVHYAKGENVHNATQNCLGMLILCKGGLCTYMLSEEGREITLYRLRAGEVCILSASCVLRQITFDVFIDAEADTDVLLIPSATIAALTTQNVYVENFAYKIAADRFSDVMWAMQQILFLGFDKRLAIFLLDETEKSGTDTIKVTHERLAKHIGSAREVVTRMLNRFADDGIVALQRGEIYVKDRAKLKKIIR